MKAPLWRQKPCSLIGKEVSQLEAPGWLARSMAFVSEGDSSSHIGLKQQMSHVHVSLAGLHSLWLSGQHTPHMLACLSSASLEMLGELLLC